jgi:hypothetical protein
LPQTPILLSQVSTERMRSSSMPALSICSTPTSSISSPALTMRLPFSGSTMSSSAERPSTRSLSGSITSPPSTTARIVRPRSVPQSSSTMMQSWATSTRRRVR